MPLDLGPLDRAQQIRAQTGTTGLAQLTGTLADFAEKRRLEKRADVKESGAFLLEQLKEAPEPTSERKINSTLMNQWESLVGDWKQQYSDSRGLLNNQQRMQMKQDLLTFGQMADEITSVKKTYDKAKQVATTGKGYERFNLNTPLYNEWLDALEGGKSAEEIAVIMERIKDTDTGFSFLDYKAVDPINIEDSIMSDYRKVAEKRKDVREVTTEKGGKRFTTKRDVVTHGTPEEARNYFSRALISHPELQRVAKGIRNSLSDNEKIEALRLYGDSKTPYLDYYVDNKFDPDRFVTGDVVAGETVKPVTGDGRKQKTVKIRNDAWDFRGERKLFAPGNMSFYEKGKRKTENFQTGYATKLNYGKIPGTNKEQLYVTVLVPKPGTDVQLRLAKGEDVPQDELIKAALAPDKSKEIYVPYDEMQDVLKDFNFENIDQFTDKAQEGKFTLEGYGDFTRKELLDAGWTDQQIDALNK
jgi:hypothetical protein